MAEEHGTAGEWLWRGGAALGAILAGWWAKRRIPKARAADSDDALQEMRRRMMEAEARIEALEARQTREELSSDDLWRELLRIKDIINAAVGRHAPHLSGEK